MVIWVGGGELSKEGVLNPLHTMKITTLQRDSKTGEINKAPKGKNSKQEKLIGKKPINLPSCFLPFNIAFFTLCNGR